MAYVNKEEEIFQGEDKRLVFTVKELDQIKNLTDAHAKFVAKNITGRISKTDEEGGILLDALTGIAIVILDAADTTNNFGLLEYELRITDSDNNSEVVAVGKIEIKKSLTI